jgi:hypothetical protein
MSFFGVQVENASANGIMVKIIGFYYATTFIHPGYLPYSRNGPNHPLFISRALGLITTWKGVWIGRSFSPWEMPKS